MDCCNKGLGLGLGISLNLLILVIGKTGQNTSRQMWGR